MADPDLRRPNASGGTSFATPTVAVDGSVIDLSDPNWLAERIDPATSG